MKKILILSDNEYLLEKFRTLIKDKKLNNNYDFNYAFSIKNKAFLKKYKNDNWIQPLDIKQKTDFLIKEFNMIFSIHCKQLFPEKLINNIKCINVHPGLNPNNRGWFPQVFSIINNLKCGATIHEIDNQLDHGPIICQKSIDIKMHDTSLSAYNKILEMEIELLSNNIEKILQSNYSTFTTSEGNLNLKKDFDSLCMINLEDKDTFKNHINKLRALTHGDYKNAYFIDDNGHKIFVKIKFTIKA